MSHWEKLLEKEKDKKEKDIPDIDKIIDKEADVLEAYKIIDKIEPNDRDWDKIDRENIKVTMSFLRGINDILTGVSNRNSTKTELENKIKKLLIQPKYFGKFLSFFSDWLQKI